MSPEIQAMIQRAAAEHGIDPRVLSTLVRIESGGRANAQTGQYGGLTMMNRAGMDQYGGGASAHDPAANVRAAAARMRQQTETFRRQHGRVPTGDELYLIHQQGEGGAAAHRSNPNQPAWRSMASTREGRERGEDWSRKAIWGNVPDDVKGQYGSVENITSGQFQQMWRDKYHRLSGIKPAGAPETKMDPMMFAQDGPGTNSSVPPGSGAPVASASGPSNYFQSPAEKKPGSSFDPIKLAGIRVDPLRSLLR